MNNNDYISESGCDLLCRAAQLGMLPPAQDSKTACKYLLFLCEIDGYLINISSLSPICDEPHDIACAAATGLLHSLTQDFITDGDLDFLGSHTLSAYFISAKKDRYPAMLDSPPETLVEVLRWCFARFDNPTIEPLQSHGDEHIDGYVNFIANLFDPAR